MMQRHFLPSSSPTSHEAVHTWIGPKGKNTLVMHENMKISGLDGVVCVWRGGFGSPGN